MKSGSLLFLSLIIGYTCTSQQSTSSLQHSTLVRTKDISNWAHTIWLFPADYWDTKSQEIIKQIGNAEFEKVKKYSHRDNIPCQLQQFCEDKDGRPKKNLDSLVKRQSELNAYKIATYMHHSNNGELKGPYAVIRVPYKENKDWDPTAKWDTVYFVIEDKYIEDANKKVNVKKKLAQKNSLVEINDWSSIQINFSSGYWSANDRDDEIVYQIGWTELGKIRKQFHLRKMPYQQELTNINEKSDTAAYYSKLRQLKLYEIATYTEKDHQDKSMRYSILRALYADNKDWNTSDKWDAYYFIVKSDAVKEIK